MENIIRKNIEMKSQPEQIEHNDIWCKMTRRLMGDTMQTTMDDILEARSENSYIGRTIDDSVDPKTRVVGRVLEIDGNYRIMSKPSKAARQGAIEFAGADGALICLTKPSDNLVYELGEHIDLTGLDELYCPTSLIGWSFALLTHYVNQRVGGQIAPELLVSLARFGEAQLCGSSEDAMLAVLEDLSSQRFRSHKRWRETLVGERVINQRSDREFEAGLVRFTRPREDQTVYLIHELDLPYYAQLALKNLSDDIDIIWAWEVRKVHYQAGEKMIDIKDLECDEMTCPICLMNYENHEVKERCAKKEGKTKMIELDYETENALGRDTENQIMIELETSGPLYDTHEENAQPIKMKCGHIFGTTCIEKWLSTNSTCPLCRVTLTGTQRVLKPISPDILTTITDFDEAWALLFCEDMDFDVDLHRVIEEAIEKRYLCAFTHLNSQFQMLRQIDKRLGVVGRKRKRNSYNDSPVARWMDKDWNRFAWNALKLREFIKGYIHSHPKWSPDQVVLNYKRALAEMLTAHRERSQ